MQLLNLKDALHHFSFVLSLLFNSSGFRSANNWVVRFLGDSNTESYCKKAVRFPD